MTRRRQVWGDVNPLALLVVLGAVVLAVTGKVPGEAVLTLLAGVAIPAKGSGYQSVPE